MPVRPLKRRMAAAAVAHGVPHAFAIIADRSRQADAGDDDAFRSFWIVAHSRPRADVSSLSKCEFEVFAHDCCMLARHGPCLGAPARAANCTGFARLDANRKLPRNRARCVCR